MFQYGAESSAYTSVFSLFTGQMPLFQCSLAVLCAIGLPLYLALDVSTTRSRCATRQRYSFPAERPGLSPALAALSIAFAASATTPCGLPLGLLPVRSPLLGKSLLVSFPALSDMLKSGACSCTVCTIRDARDAPRLSRPCAPVIAAEA